ncbi:Kef-type potassium/proton antiporter, CPA2 family [Sphingobium sp. AP50]|uniref:cation:proton antiporter domain-containing protein n=1 Tax=Sphingobium sp. AP50 TaxID=1884369 RepID=UPI0008B2C874|nr:cation:proton antiporter [Sphingobium sp. AP50]SEJ81681.1 Kef-type potassium/proton antiporter, CPA2 family [Sphingobium sp. AP50]
MTSTHLLSALMPVIVLLAFGIGAAILSRWIGLSPIVGYLTLGLVLKAVGLPLGPSQQTIDVLAELGVLFLLFDIGLHFSFRKVRAQASDIFGFGPAQVAIATSIVGVIAWMSGIAFGAALLLGATLALSSTAVVARIIADRHQQDCPVGVTATAILVFQDLAGIFVLIIAASIGSGASPIGTSIDALGKAAACFGAAMLLGKIAVQPVLNIIARARNEEIFTAVALLVALATGWVTGSLGLSVTLGAFLGGAMLADTPFRPIIQSEIKPFRGLLLGFFFVSVGLSLDVESVVSHWYLIVFAAAGLLGLKITANMAASLLFQWSVPGSVHLAFLLAQGSEFAFVIFSLPPVQLLLGPQLTAVIVPAVALTLVITPNIATWGRTLAGRLRANRSGIEDPELLPNAALGPVLIVGMGPVGRAIADALGHFDIGYMAMESDQRRLREALADGYRVAFGDITDPRMWEPVSLAGRRISVLTEPLLDIASRITPIAQHYFPYVTRLAVVSSTAEAVRFAEAGLQPIVERAGSSGLDTVEAVLDGLDIDPVARAEWINDRRARHAAEKTNAPDDTVMGMSVVA